MRIGILAVIVFFAFSCHQRMARTASSTAHELFSEKTDSQAPLLLPPSSLSWVLHIERIGCGGPCPEWEAFFYENGKAVWMPADGNASRAAFSPDHWKILAEEATATGFFQLPDTLGFIPQLPGWKIAIRKDSLFREVVYNHQAPPSLRLLEHKLEEWVLAQDWERIYP